MLAVMTASHPETTFAEATSVKATSSHTYEADFPEDWCIGSGRFSLARIVAVSRKRWRDLLAPVVLVMPFSIFWYRTLCSTYSAVRCCSFGSSVKPYLQYRTVLPGSRVKPARC